MLVLVEVFLMAILEYAFTGFLAVIAVVSSSLQVISCLIGDMFTCAACIIYAVSEVIIPTGMPCEANLSVSSSMGHG